MNRTEIIRVLLSILSVFCFLWGNAEIRNGRKYLRFNDLITSSHPISLQSVMPSKSERSSSSKGLIILVFEEDIPENIRVAVEAARDYWEAKIPAQQAIWIQINMSELEENIATQVDVEYY